MSDRIDVRLVLGWRSDRRDHLAVGVVDKIGTKIETETKLKHKYETKTEIETEKYFKT